MDIKYPSWLKTDTKKTYGWNKEGYEADRKAYVPPSPKLYRKNLNSMPQNFNQDYSLGKLPAEAVDKGGVFGKKAWNYYKETHKDTPDFIKPFGYGVEAIWRVPFLDRTLTTGGETLAGKGAVIGDDGKARVKPELGKVGNFVADTGGNIIGSSFKMGGISPLQATDIAGEKAGEFVAKNLPKLGNNLLSKGIKSLLPAAVRGAVDVGGGNALQTGVQGGTAKETLQAAKEGALGGAVFFGGGKLIKDVASPILKSAFPKWITTFEDGKVELKPVTKEAPTLNGKFTVKNTALEKAEQKYTDAIEEIQNHFQTNKLTPEEVAKIKPELGIDLDKILSDMETAKTDIKAIAERKRMGIMAGVNDIPTNKLQTPDFKPIKTLEDFKPFNNAIPQPTNKMAQSLNTEGIKTPLDNFKQEPSNLTKERKLKNSTIKSELTSPELKTLIEKTDMNYNPINNDDTMEFASKAIKNHPEDALKLVKSNAPATAESNSMAQLFVQNLQDKGKYDEAIEIIEITAKKATTQGQAIQSLSMWGRLTPEGMLRHVQTTFNKVNNELAEKGVKNAENLRITPELLEDITKKMKAIQKMPEGSEKVLEVAKVLADIDENIPKSLGSKISTIQAMAQLLNPKTITRNIVGNGIFAGLENVSNTISAPIDFVLKRVTGQRTTLFPSVGTQLKGGKEGFIQGVKEALSGVNIDKMGGKFELGQQGRTFKKNTVLGKFETGMDLGLRVPDKAFSEAARKESLRQQMKIAGVTTPTKGMEDIADQIAKYRTFQDDNGISNGLKWMKDSLNNISSFFTGTKDFGLGDLIIKYAKTPGNILARAIDYSPLGAIKVIREAAAPLGGKVFNQKVFVDAIGRVTTGTGMIALGYGLNKIGVITGKADKDIDMARLNKEVGKSPYSINFAALNRYLKSGNVEDAKPQPGDKFTTWDWAAPTSIMIGIGANVSQSKGNAADLLTTIADASVSGMNTLFEQPVLSGLQQLTSFGNIPEGLKRAGLGIPSSFTPTILKQIAQTQDNTARNTYNPSALLQSIDQVKAKIPSLSKGLQPQITTQGNERQNFESKGLKKLFDIFVNPSFSNTYKPSDVTNAVEKIYTETGNKTQFPKVAPKTIYYYDKTKKRQPYDLSPDEYTYYQKELGTKTTKAISDILKLNPNASSEDYLKAITNKINKLSSEIQYQILRKRGLIQ